MGRNRKEQPEVQVPQYMETPAAARGHDLQETLQPYVSEVPYDERQADGRDWRIYWPSGKAVDVNLDELAYITQHDIREVARLVGYKTPSDAVRLEELADAQAGRITGQGNGQPSNVIELSVGELNLKDLTFKGDPSALFGGHRQQGSPFEQAAMAFLANRSQQAAGFQSDAPAAESLRQQDYWATPVAGTLDILDVEPIDEPMAPAVSAEPQPTADPGEQSEDQAQPAPTAPEAKQLTRAESRAKRKKILSRIGAMGVAASISFGGYSVMSYPLGLSEHNLLKADVIGYNKALLEAAWSLL